MPFEITFDNVPIGIAVSASRAGDTTVNVQQIYFTSSEDGQKFVEQLEGFPDDILRRLPSDTNLHPPDIKHLVAIIRNDRTATVYINGEVNLIGTVQQKRSFTGGDSVYLDDIADIQRVEIEDLYIPDTAGVLLVFSVGWRKGLFFDFSPLGPHAVARDYDINLVFGQCFANVMFQELFRITDPQWSSLLSQQWFPFRCLKADTIKQILSCVKQGWQIDDLLDKVVEELIGQLDVYKEQWAHCAIFIDHIAVLSQGAERFRSGDYISCTSIIFPRIEGILRSFHRRKGETSKPSQTALAASAVSLDSSSRHERCLLLPERFERYLIEVYFAAFDPNTPKIVVSRNSVAHGVVASDELSAKAAAIGIMIIQQILYYAQPLDSVSPPKPKVTIQPPSK